MEFVVECYIINVCMILDIDCKKFIVDVIISISCFLEVVEVKVFDGKQLVVIGKGLNGQIIDIQMFVDVKLWSFVFLIFYFMQIVLLSNGKVIDKVDSYIVMCKYFICCDKDGIVCLQLNNEDVFQFGFFD